MSDPKQQDLAAFFGKHKSKKKVKKSKKSVGVEEAGIDQEEEGQQITSTTVAAAVEDFAAESDEEVANEELMQEAAAIQNLNEVVAQQKKDANLAELGDKTGFDMIFKKDGDQSKPLETAAPVKKKPTGGPINFSGGRPPMFNRGKQTALNKNEFPGLGDFPTMGDNKSTSKVSAPEENVSKCNQASLGSFSSAAVKSGGPRPEGDSEQKKGGVVFGGKPMFTRSSKNKNMGTPLNVESDNAKDNYDFSKMRTSAVAQRRPREEDDEENKNEEKPEDLEPKTEQLQERRVQKSQPVAFDMHAPVEQKKSSFEPVEDEEGFQTVQQDIRQKRTGPVRAQGGAPYQFTNSGGATKFNKFDNDWGNQHE